MPVLTGSALGCFFVFITLFLEPHGTDRYEASFRTLRLSGYALCFLVPFVGIHALDRWIFRLQGNRWYIYNELISKPLLILAITALSYLYNHLVINEITPTLSGFVTHLIHYGLPYLPLLVPPAIYLYRKLGRQSWAAPPGPADELVIQGRNRDERLTLASENFLFAEAQQNYVTVFHQRDGAIGEHMIRATLSEVHRQVPLAVRVHRSYLVNPEHVVAVEGNVRKRVVHLAEVDRPIPVSAGFDPAALKA